MRMTAYALATMAVFIAAPTLAAKACPAERATYTLKTDAKFTAGFIPAKHSAGIASDLYFWIKSPQRTYWFTMAVGNGYSGIYLSPVGDPYVADKDDPDNGPTPIDPQDVNPAYLRMYPMLKDMTVQEAPPSKGDAAPDAVFTPEIGTVLWYSPNQITLDATASRDPMDRGVFLRSGCLSKVPKPALP